jgi:hypothetical protein
MVSRNYGIGQVGLYASTRFQAVFAMGESYLLAADGTGVGSLYGIAWSYPSAGGPASNLASHGMLILENGVFKGAWGGGSLRTPSDIRGTLYYDWDNTGFYVDPASTSITNDMRASIFYDRENTSYYVVPRSVSIMNDVRANILYDAGNTAFYIDPASTSLVNNVQITTLGVGTTASGTTGEIRATNNITAYYSDARLKNFTGTIGDALEKVMQLNGYYFFENDVAKSLGYDNDERQVGVSAQEVAKVLPEVVTDAPINGNFEGADYKTVRYEKLVPLLIEAIKEQQRQIEELQRAVLKA